MFNFKSSSFSRFGTVPRALSIMGATWYLNPGYICCSSDINGIYLSAILSAIFLWRLAMLKSSGTPTSTIVHVVRFLSHMSDNVWSVMFDLVWCL